MDSRTFSPPIQSIWIEEDQFMEKIYGFQVDQLLEPDTNASNIFGNESLEEKEEEEEEQRARILIINSDTPLLGNNSNVPLKKSTKSLDNRKGTFYSSSLTENKNVSFPQRLLNVLKKNNIINRMKSQVVDRNNSHSSKKKNISVPFQFQHISHGEDQVKITSEVVSDTSTHIQGSVDINPDVLDDTTENTIFGTMTSKTSVAFSAFCTPRLNTNSVNSSQIFDLERKENIQSLSSPTTLVATSTFQQSV
ncbi:hypothetical protein MOUN0_N07558 [Monosporozyma unispora]|nr:hypothetical protein C6P44_003638 [Kazachstania unispora]